MYAKIHSLAHLNLRAVEKKRFLKTHPILFRTWEVTGSNIGPEG
jgi:hypothetical protein